MNHSFPSRIVRRQNIKWRSNCIPYEIRTHSYSYW